jgi:hypothetical protein
MMAFFPPIKVNEDANITVSNDHDLVLVVHDIMSMPFYVLLKGQHELWTLHTAHHSKHPQEITLDLWNHYLPPPLECRMFVLQSQSPSHTAPSLADFRAAVAASHVSNPVENEATVLSANTDKPSDKPSRPNKKSRKQQTAKASGDVTQVPTGKLNASTQRKYKAKSSNLGQKNIHNYLDGQPTPCLSQPPAQTAPTPQEQLPHWANPATDHVPEADHTPNLKVSTLNIRGNVIDAIEAAQKDTTNDVFILTETKLTPTKRKRWGKMIRNASPGYLKFFSDSPNTSGARGVTVLIKKDIAHPTSHNYDLNNIPPGCMSHITIRPKHTP